MNAMFSRRGASFLANATEFMSGADAMCPHISAGDTAWMMTATGFVLFMTVRSCLKFIDLDMKVCFIGCTGLGCLFCETIKSFFQPGLSFFYGGLVPRKSVLTIMMQVRIPSYWYTFLD